MMTSARWSTTSARPALRSTSPTFKKEEETFAFTVLSASKIVVGEHTLAGRYVGQGFSLGWHWCRAAVLVGGNNDNFSQPLAVEGNTGIGAAAGLGFLYIEKSR